jgi:hypothetical protein
VPAAILLAAGLIIFATLPPRTVTMATGAAGGANHELGLRYREILARSGVRLRLVNTTGGLDNLASARPPVGREAFIQAARPQKESPNVESSAPIFQPLWVFYRMIGGALRIPRPPRFDRPGKAAVRLRSNPETDKIDAVGELWIRPRKRRQTYCRRDRHRLHRVGLGSAVLRRLLESGIRL